MSHQGGVSWKVLPGAVLIAVAGHAAALAGALDAVEEEYARRLEDRSFVSRVDVKQLRMRRPTWATFSCDPVFG